MARLTVWLLGPPEIRLDGEPVTGLVSNKVRALLFFLATEADRRRPETVAHRRETLAGLLWPDYPERSAHTNLSNALSLLRTALRDRDRVSTQAHPYLLVDRETVQFDRQSDCWVDVATFTEPVGLRDPSSLEQAVALYRGPFLEGFTLKDSPAFEQWVLVMRERLQRQAMEALARLVALEEGRGEYERACAHARRELELEPWHEEAHRALMRLLALSGQRSEALAQYEACRRILKEELDVEPGAETVRLYEQIRDEADLSSSGKPDRSVQQPSLPTWLTPFIGREELLAEIRERLSDPGCRLLTLVGPGGSGKTRLAVEAAGRLSDRWPHGVHFVSLAPLESVESVVPTVAQAIGFSFSPGTNPRQQLLDYLRQKQMLLVLDNYEHLLGGAGLVVEILRAAPGVKALVTSRARLNVQGENLLPVSGMSAPQEGAAEDMQRSSAVRLFLQSARQVAPGMELEEEDLANVARVCRLVEGMPLAIMLAAAWADMLTPAEIAARIEKQSLEFLQADWQDAPERQRSMRAALDHSWHLLTERQQVVLAALAVFRGGFSEEAAGQVAGASLRDLKGLADRSLLHRTPVPLLVPRLHPEAQPEGTRPLATASPEGVSPEGLRARTSAMFRASGRYEMHELLRQYGDQRLSESSDAGQGARGRHAAYYAAALERWAAELKGPRQQAALGEMDFEIDNARAAWEWAVTRGQVEWLSQGMEGLGMYCEQRGRYPEGEAAFRVAADCLAVVDGGLEAMPADRQRALARLWAWQSGFSRNLGHLGLARKLQSQGLDLLGALERAGEDIRWEQAFLLWRAATAQLSNRREARLLAEQSVALYRAVGARWEMAGVLRELGEHLQALGFYDEAARVQHEVLAIYRELGDPRGIAGSFSLVGWVLFEQGDPAEAERLTREALVLQRALNDTPDLVQLSIIVQLQGRFAEARSLAEDALASAAESWSRLGLPGHIITLSECELHLGQYGEARLRA